MSIGIYKITSPSNKVYIGQSVDIERRFKHYKNIDGIKGQKKVYYSIQKYGYENHKFEIIEECFLDELNSKEIYWMEFFQSISLGLNICEGGNNFGRINKGVKRSESVKVKISCTKKLNPRVNTPDMIQNCRNASTTKKPIYQYTLKGEFIKEWESINEASRKLNIRNDGISGCLRKQQRTAYGYQWFYTLQDKVLPITEYSKPSKWIGNRNIKIDNRINEILEMYSKGINITQISKKFRVHRDVIKNRIKNNL
jgi:hypothetical protein